MSGLYTSIVSKVLFPIHERLKKHNSVALLKELEKTQWKSGDEIEKIRVRNLSRFLKDIYTNVPYYKKVVDDSGLDIENISNVSDLQKLPFLTKQIIKNNTEALRANYAGELKRYNTGGSTGEPLVFYMGKDRVSHDVASKWRATRWWDVDIGDKELVIWGSPVELGAQDRVRMLRDKIVRSELISAFDISHSNVKKLIDHLVRFRPKMVFGYPSSISLIAISAEKQGIKLDKLGIKVVFVTSEKLYDHQRETIERVFACPVANGYGGRDAGFIAHQCPQGNMHITAEDIIVEIVDEQGRILPAGKAGEIVVTNMATREFPFVRYKIGDIGILSDESCACGRGLPILADVQGRSTDFIVTPDGRVMHGLALIYVLRDIPAVLNFKIVQEAKDRIEIKMQVSPEYNEDTRKKILTELTQRLGADVNIRLEIVDKVEKEKSGKFRYVVSKIDPFS
ncbi:MAG: AMP-binding protein [Gammaproteobacteria bacterium]|nr:AMP-binding protein [Gammaproteobacteria bacterium]